MLCAYEWKGKAVVERVGEGEMKRAEGESAVLWGTKVVGGECIRKDRGEGWTFIQFVYERAYRETSDNDPFNRKIPAIKTFF
jgi:hypothetical protein